MTSPPSALSPLTSVGVGGPGLLIRGVFRVPLENLPRGKDVDEPEVLHQMFLYLATVVHTEGLFRISGSVEEMNRLRAALDAKEKVDFVKIDQPHVIAGLLKQFFRELPSAFLSEDFASTIEEDTNVAIRIYKTKKLIEGLSAVRKCVLQHLLKLLHSITLSPTSKMSADNLGRVFGPNLFPRIVDGGMSHLERATITNQIISEMIEWAPLLLSPTPNEMIERQSKMISHRKDNFLAWIAFFQEERPPSGFTRHSSSSSSTTLFSSSLSVGADIVLSDWCLEQVSSIPSVDKMLFGLPVSFGVGSVRRKHLNIDVPIVNTVGNESPSASRRAVAHQIQLQQQLSPGSPSFESAQTASCQFSEIVLTERSAFNIMKGLLHSFPSSNDPQELEVTKIILRYLLENLTEEELGVVTDSLQELSHFGLTDSYIDSLSLLFHWNRRRPPSFYQKVHSYEKDILETAQTLTPSSLATFKAASLESGELDSQQLIDCCHHVDLWLEVIKHQVGLVSLLYRRQEVDTKTRLDVDLHTSRLLDYFQKLRNDSSASPRREDQDDLLPSVPTFIPATSSGSSTTRPNASEECNSQRCKVVKSLQDCLEKERKLLEELHLLRVSIKDFNKVLSEMNDTIWKKAEKLLNILRRRYETQRKEIEKELKDRLRILLEAIDSFLNDGISTLLERCSSLLRGVSTPLVPALPPTPCPSPSTSTDAPPPFLAAITGLGGGSGLGIDSSNALRNQMQINSCLVRCREWTEAISAALKEADVVSAVRNRKGAGRSSGARIVLGSNVSEQRTGSGLRIGGAGAGIGAGVGVGGIGGEGDSDCVLKRLEDKVQQLLSRGLEILNQDGGEGYVASFRGGAKKDKRTWRPARNRSASSLN